MIRVSDLRLTYAALHMKVDIGPVAGLCWGIARGVQKEPHNRLVVIYKWTILVLHSPIILVPYSAIPVLYFALCR